jgi:hypothetical protein
MAAHGQLWQETHPQHPLTGYHLLILPKDGSPFQHHAYDDLSRSWRIFELYLEAYRLEKETKPFAKPKTARTAKPKPEQVTASVHTTMAEMLRAYGHVGECRT